ncbi:MAG: hypothetical protein HYU39_10265 [Thaumarchaeota archaeon]|nr:hypothetical protein [Nitrososphaerota archaeon]
MASIGVPGERDEVTNLMTAVDEHESQLHSLAPQQHLDTIHGALGRAHPSWNFCPFCGAKLRPSAGS